MKREKVNWCLAILELGEQEIEVEYYKFLQNHKEISRNRCAYYVLRQYFNLNSLKFYRKFGHFPGVRL